MEIKIKRFNFWKCGYKLDRLIFNGAMIIIFIYLFGVLWQHDFDFSPRIRVACDGGEPCENPFYKNPVPKLGDLPARHKDKCTYDWCSWPTLPAGFEFGEQPSKSFKFAPWFAALILSLAFILNHFWHNKNFFKEGDKHGGN